MILYFGYEAERAIAQNVLLIAKNTRLLLKIRSAPIEELLAIIF